MKHWNLILGLFLCLIAIGGLVVLFRAEPDENENKGQSSIEQPSDDVIDSGGDSTEPIDIESIEINETRLIF